MMNNTHAYLSRALALASQRRGYCAPNPAVGAVVVCDGEIVGEGCHWQAGKPHAEVMAIKNAGKRAEGASIYVTLEPCNHQGRTPPCTQLILDSGIQRVFYAHADPNASVIGGGGQFLVDNGLEVVTVDMPDIAAFYQSYDHWLQHQRPWVTLKLAMSLDGKIAGPAGQRIQITGKQSKQLTYYHRRHSDAILTTQATILADNPTYLSLPDEGDTETPLFILARKPVLPASLHIFRQPRQITVLHDANVDSKILSDLHGRGIKTQGIKSTDNYVDLLSILNYIGAQGIHNLWVEAGGRLSQAMFEADLVHTALLYVAPKWLGSDAMPAFQSLEAPWAPAKQIFWFRAGEDIVGQWQFHGSPETIKYGKILNAVNI